MTATRPTCTGDQEKKDKLRQCKCTENSQWVSKTAKLTKHKLAVATSDLSRANIVRTINDMLFWMTLYICVRTLGTREEMNELDFGKCKNPLRAVALP